MTLMCISGRVACGHCGCGGGYGSHDGLRRKVFIVGYKTCSFSDGGVWVRYGNCVVMGEEKGDGIGNVDCCEVGG